ncbi:MAG: hypothetical protein WCV67_20160 [Victivallaceae bacterium]|jgi:hypothetical protein
MFSLSLPKNSKHPAASSVAEQECGENVSPAVATDVMTAAGNMQIILCVSFFSQESGTMNPLL